MALDRDSLEILARALNKLDAGFSQLPRFDPAFTKHEHDPETSTSLLQSQLNAKNLKR